MYQFTVAFLFGALVASGWWALSMFGWPDYGEHNEVWRFLVALFTCGGTVAASGMITIGAFVDAVNNCQDVSDESDKEETET